MGYNRKHRKPGIGTRRGIRNRKERERREREEARLAAQFQKSFPPKSLSERQEEQRRQAELKIIPNDEIGLLIRLAGVTQPRFDQPLRWSMITEISSAWYDRYGTVREGPAGDTLGQLYAQMSAQLQRIRDPVWQWINKKDREHHFFLGQVPTSTMMQFEWNVLAREAKTEFGATLPDFRPMRSPNLHDFYVMLKAELDKLQQEFDQSPVGDWIATTLFTRFHRRFSIMDRLGETELFELYTRTEGKFGVVLWDQHNVTIPCGMQDMVRIITQARQAA